MTNNLKARVPAGTALLLKGMFLVVAFATTPAAAQSYDPDIGTGNIVPYYGQQPGPMPQDARNAYAKVPSGGGRRVRTLSPAALRANASMGNAGRDPDGMVGTDPDPNIRFQLNRESLQGRW